MRLKLQKQVNVYEERKMKHLCRVKKRCWTQFNKVRNTTLWEENVLHTPYVFTEHASDQSTEYMTELMLLKVKLTAVTLG